VRGVNITGTPRELSNGVETKGVFGYGDFDGDGNENIVFRGFSGQIKMGR